MPRGGTVSIETFRTKMKDKEKEKYKDAIKKGSTMSRGGRSVLKPILTTNFIKNFDKNFFKVLIPILDPIPELSHSSNSFLFYF